MYYKQGFLDKAERKFGRFAIPKLMNYVIFGMAGVFIIDIFAKMFLNISFIHYLAFDTAKILSGQVWRVITFIFIPTTTSVVFAFFSMYFYWLIGNTLEQQWGTFKFNLFYLVGMLGTAISGIIIGGATNTYINLSLFLAFAFLYPNFEVRLFFIIPIKMKYLAILDIVLLVFSALTNTLALNIALLVSVANLLLFFWKPLVNNIRDFYRKQKWKRNNRR